MPSGENLTQVMPSECPFNGYPNLAILYESHIIALESQLPVTIFLLFGEKHTLVIADEWPFNGSPI